MCVCVCVCMYDLKNVLQTLYGDIPKVLSKQCIIVVYDYIPYLLSFNEPRPNPIFWVNQISLFLFICLLDF